MAADAAFNTAGDTTVTFPNTSLGRQLRQVARIIKDSPALNVTRQIFYVQVGSFDTHSNQISGQGGLLTTVGQALRSFWDELGAQGMQNSVTTFTMSDFNRTFNPAGSGSGVGTDHAWGNHMLVLGGSVIGGDFYGSLRPDGSGNYFPTLTLGGPDDVDTGSAPRCRRHRSSSMRHSLPAGMAFRRIRPRLRRCSQTLPIFREHTHNSDFCHRTGEINLTRKLKFKQESIYGGFQADAVSADETVLPGQNRER